MPLEGRNGGRALPLKSKAMDEVETQLIMNFTKARGRLNKMSTFQIKLHSSLL